MAYTCFSCEDERAAVVQIFTSLENGHTVAACEDCLPVAFIGGLSTVLGVDAQKLYDVIKRFADRQAREAAKLPEGGTVPIDQFMAGSAGGPDQSGDGPAGDDGPVSDQDANYMSADAREVTQ